MCSNAAADNLLKTFEDKYLGDLSAGGEPLNMHEQPLQRAAWHDHALWLKLDGSEAPVSPVVLPIGQASQRIAASRLASWPTCRARQPRTRTERWAIHSGWPLHPARAAPCTPHLALGAL